MSRAGTDSDTESQTQRDPVTEYPQQAIAKRIEIERKKWNSCGDWDEAMELNRQFYSGEIEVNVLDSSFDQRDMENDILGTLLDSIYIIRYQQCRVGKCFTQDCETLIIRQMGSCCFMLPHEHRLVVPLMAALLDSRQLYTVVMYRGNADPVDGSAYNFDCDVRYQDIKSRSIPADLNPWSPFATESPAEVHSELLELWEKLHGLDCHALISSDPILFRVRTRESETDILKTLSEIVDRENQRHSFDYVIGRYNLV
jgi:hypothetical protein